MRKPLSILLFLSLAGCGSVKEILRPLTPRMFRDSLPPVVAPGFTLPAKAAKAQDSLRERLGWISQQKLPKDFSLERIAFEVGADSNLVLGISVQDDERLNSHGLSRQQIKEHMRERLRKARPLVAEVRTSGIGNPILLKSAFRSRDFLFQNARWVDDSVHQWWADSLPVH